MIIPCTHSPFVQQRTTAFPRSSCSLLRYPSGSFERGMSGVGATLLTAVQWVLVQMLDLEEILGRRVTGGARGFRADRPGAGGQVDVRWS